MCRMSGDCVCASLLQGKAGGEVGIAQCRCTPTIRLKDGSRVCVRARVFVCVCVCVCVALTLCLCMHVCAVGKAVVPFHCSSEVITCCCLPLLWNNQASECELHGVCVCMHTMLCQN